MRINMKHGLTFGLTAFILFVGQPAIASTIDEGGAPQLQSKLLADSTLPWIVGKVVKISKKRGVITIAHEAISNLSMPSMTMPFKPVIDSAINDLKAGDSIEFQTERKDGKLILLGYRNSSS